MSQFFSTDISNTRNQSQLIETTEREAQEPSMIPTAIYDQYIPLTASTTGVGSVVSTTGDTNSREYPRVFALIVGIDRYSKSSLNLKWAAKDAERVKQYLQINLGVPESRIRMLLNEDATRSSIIHELESLISNAQISTEDPVVVYFAGHGGEATAPPSWGGGDAKAQMFLPHDYKSQADRLEDIKHGIPSRTIGILLENLANKIGDNIILILDCCHAEFKHRNMPSLHQSRFVVAQDVLPRNIDQVIYEGSRQRGGKHGDIFRFHGNASHILLAACNAEESIGDVEEGGFTDHLIRILKKKGADKVTYLEAILLLPKMPHQSPRCEGRNRNHCFFDSKIAVDAPRVVTMREGEERYILNDGSALGIVMGDEFQLFHRRDRTNSLPGIFVVTETKVNESILEPAQSDAPRIIPIASGDILYAFQKSTRANEVVNLWIAGDLRLSEIRGRLENVGGEPLRRYKFVDQRSDAQLELAIEDESVVFNILERRITIHGLSSMPFQIPLIVLSDSETYELMATILRRTAFFYYHLLRTPPNLIQNSVELQFLKVKRGGYDETWKRIILDDGTNLIKDGKVKIKEGYEIYGIKIENVSHLRIYPNIFFFDCSDLSIDSFYLPPVVTSEDIEEPLPPNNSLKIGYGVGQDAPWKFFLRRKQYIDRYISQREQAVDVGFIKVFITCVPADFSSIRQETPFQANYLRGTHTMNDDEPIEIWDSILIPLIVTKASANESVAVNS